MGQIKDISGNRYGKLKVLYRHEKMRISPNGKRSSRYECLCDCGATKTISGSDITTGHTKSCGCIHKEQLSERNKKHGMTKTPEYISWQSMKARCLNPKASHYEFYGGREIKICERWVNSFDNFYADMGKRNHGMSLDRIDPDGDYEPNNCRWANQATQDFNKRNTRMISYHGIEKPLAEWAKQFKIKYETLRHRIYTHGWSVEKAFTTKIAGGEKHE